MAVFLLAEFLQAAERKSRKLYVNKYICLKKIIIYQNKYIIVLNNISILLLKFKKIKASNLSSEWIL